ncbi:DUF167 domain-containing protein [Candidatus Falkowbacteria bacterium]|nr:DUF167 domain-containing protein [Candidatus Falkowbacteria bacterium]
MNQPTVQELAIWQEAVANNQAWRLTVKVITSCPRHGWQGHMADGSWKIGLAEPAIDNRANRALLAWLAKELACSVNRLKITSGQTSRRKIISYIVQV